MGVKNVIPKTYIIAETKIDEAAIRSFLEEVEEPAWQKRWLNNELSDGEKVVDLSCSYCENINPSVEINSEQILIDLGKKNTLNSFLNHAKVTVLFHKVSFIFCKKILESKVDMDVNFQDINFGDMGFWYPPSFGILPELAIGFGETVKQYDDLKQYLSTKIEQLESNDRKEKNKAIMDIARLFPTTTQINGVITTGLGNWFKCFETFCQFDSDHELRMVFLNLASKFKKRYPSIFKNMVMENKNGNQFGFDSLKESHNAWQNYQIVLRY